MHSHQSLASGSRPSRSVTCFRIAAKRTGSRASRKAPDVTLQLCRYCISLLLKQRRNKRLAYAGIDLHFRDIFSSSFWLISWFAMFSKSRDSISYEFKNPMSLLITSYVFRYMSLPFWQKVYFFPLIYWQFINFRNKLNLNFLNFQKKSFSSNRKSFYYDQKIKPFLIPQYKVARRAIFNGGRLS